MIFNFYYCSNVTESILEHYIDLFSLFHHIDSVNLNLLAFSLRDVISHISNHVNTKMNLGKICVGLIVSLLIIMLPSFGRKTTVMKTTFHLLHA